MLRSIKTFRLQKVYFWSQTSLLQENIPSGSRRVLWWMYLCDWLFTKLEQTMH
jgi:hypothetical protein